MATSAQLERDTEACRTEIERTLDELRNRMSPGEVVNQLVDYARDGNAGQFMHNLQQQVVSNPLPLARVGIGLGWLMISGRRPTGQARHDGRSASTAAKGAAESAAQLGQRASETAGEWTDSARAAAHHWSDRTRASVDAAADQVRDASTAVSDATKAAGENIASTATAAYRASANAAGEASAKLGDAATAMRGAAGSITQTMRTLFHDQPLILAGIGVALGAAIGAALPGTETEDRLMGDASTDIKERAQDIATQGVAATKDVAEHVFEKAKSEVEKASDAASSTEHQDASAERSREPEPTTTSPSLVPPVAGDRHAYPETEVAENDRERR